MARCSLAHRLDGLDHTLTTSPGLSGPMGKAKEEDGVDHPARLARLAQEGGEDHNMERNPLISPRGLAADHCMSRLMILHFSG